MNFRLAQPAVLIDLNRIKDLDHVQPEGPGGLRIGAMTRHRTLEHDPRVAELAPLLHEAAPFIAHPQIRNRGTLGGSLAHADARAELPAVAVALRARMRLQRAGGERWVEARDFFTGLLSTVLEPEEILTEVALPPMPAKSGWAFQEIARRHGDYAQVGLAAVVSLDEAGRCREARLVYLSVGDRPVEAREAARLLEGAVVSDEAIAAAADKASRDEMDPNGDVHASADFKRHLARVLTGRVLRRAFDRAQGAKGTKGEA